MALTKVTTSLVAINTLTAANIADNAIDATKIAQNNIVARHIPNATALVLDGGVTIDNITIDGTEIDLSSGSLTVDVAGDIYLDADGGDIVFKDGGTDFGEFSSASNNLTMKSSISDADIKFNGNDGGSAITALTLDMSAAGAASFNAGITSAEAITVTNGNSTFTTASSWGAGLTIKQTNDDASPAYLSLHKDPASGHSTMADNDYIGFINMKAKDDAGNAHTYVELAGVATDVSNGAEPSKFSINTWGAGTEYATNLVATGGKVGIGTASPSTKLDLYDGSSDAIVQMAWENDAREWRLGVHGGVSDSLVLYDNTASATRMVVDSSGNVGIGETSPEGILHVKGAQPNVVISNTTQDGTSTKLSLIEKHGVDGWLGGFIRYNGSTNNMTLGTIHTGTTETHHIYLPRDGSGDVKIGLGGSGGDLVLQPLAKLYLDAGGDTYIVESSGNEVDVYTGGARRLRVNQDGLIFNTDTATANALDDYEEGTFTPSWTVAGGGSVTGVSSTNVGTYTKIGNFVHVTVKSHYVQTTGTVPTSYSITLPFQAKNTGGMGGYGLGQEIGQSGKNMFVSIGDNATTAVVKAALNGAPPANSYMDLSFTYQAA